MIITKKLSWLFILLMLASSCSQPEDTAMEKRKKRSHKVETYTTVIEPVHQHQTVSGTLEAMTSVRLHNEESGRITWLPFHESDRVSQGDEVIRLDGALIQAELDKAIAEHNKAKADLDRIKKLVKKKLASEEALVQAQTELNVAAAEEKLQRTRFSRTSIKAPFDGIITERNNEVGDVIAPYTHVLSMIAPDSLHIKVQVSDNWLGLIDNNSDAEITIDALNNLVHQGRISRIYPTISPDTRKGTIEIEFKNRPDGIRAGQLARIKIKSRSVNRLLVPSHAIRHDSKGAYLFVASADNTSIKKYVEKGLQLGNQIEITQGLDTGELVVTKGFSTLRDGTSIQIVAQHQDAK